MQTRFLGSSTLDELKRTVEDTQTVQKAKLTHMEGVEINGENFNLADFNFVSRRKEIPDEVIFVEVTDSSEIPSIIAEQLPNLLIFKEEIYIENTLAYYLGFSRFS